MEKIKEIDLLKEHCLIRYIPQPDTYLHPVQDHPEIKSKLYVVRSGKDGAAVFRDTEAKRFIADAKDPADLEIEYIITPIGGGYIG